MQRLQRWPLMLSADARDVMAPTLTVDTRSDGLPQWQCINAGFQGALNDKGNEKERAKVSPLTNILR